uniref:Uncharacterized protein n=1 Tax=Nelumbo nucifera TaxID=4432 RepID=A0A822ZY94_NELNU|nr:TPA_asm: hypothetical protein HUJ06_016835 [Nelumbo nucifera]
MSSLNPKSDLEPNFQYTENKIYNDKPCKHGCEVLSRCHEPKDLPALNQPQEKNLCTGSFNQQPQGIVFETIPLRLWIQSQ